MQDLRHENIVMSQQVHTFIGSKTIYSLKFYNFLYNLYLSLL